MISLNLVKPISPAEKRIGKKCGWKNIEDIPVRKNILPKDFVGKAKPDNTQTIGTKLTKDNFRILEMILDDNKLAKSPFVKANMTELLKKSKSQADEENIIKLLSHENIDKIDFQRYKVSKNPRMYVKDKTMANYLKSPAGLNKLFNDINILKAAEILDKENMDILFKMDITQGEGRKILNKIGEMNYSQLEKIKNDMKEIHNDTTSNKIFNILFLKNE